MINNVVLVGRICADPELRYAATGTAIATFTLAVNRRKQGEVDFINIVAFQKQAESCAQYLAKGSLIAIEGRIQVRKYENKDGQKRTAVEVVANSVQFLDSKKQQRVPGEDDQMAISDQDVPF